MNSAYAQSLPPVTAAASGSGSEWWVIGVAVVLVAVALVAGFLWLKRHHPTAALAVATTAHADATSALADAVSMLHKAVSALDAKLALAPAVVAVAEVPGAPAGPTPDQLAAIAAAQAALDSAKKAAGVA